MTASSDTGLRHFSANTGLTSRQKTKCYASWPQNINKIINLDILRDMSGFYEINIEGTEFLNYSQRKLSLSRLCISTDQ